MIRKLTLLILLALILVPGLLLSGCAADKGGSDHDMDMSGLKMAPMSGMPEKVKEASATTQQAYQFAVANPDVLKELPCYCGCGAMGHKSNYSCYVQNDEGGKITFDQHALGCGICVDITQDAMRGISKGQSIQEIKAYVDKTYSQYGPSNMEP